MRALRIRLSSCEWSSLDVAYKKESGAGVKEDKWRETSRWLRRATFGLSCHVCIMGRSSPEVGRYISPRALMLCPLPDVSAAVPLFAPPPLFPANQLPRRMKESGSLLICRVCKRIAIFIHVIVREEWVSFIPLPVIVSCPFSFVKAIVAIRLCHWPFHWPFRTGCCMLCLARSGKNHSHTPPRRPPHMDHLRLPFVLCSGLHIDSVSTPLPLVSSTLNLLHLATHGSRVASPYPSPCGSFWVIIRRFHADFRRRRSLRKATKGSSRWAKPPVKPATARMDLLETAPSRPRLPCRAMRARRSR